MVSLARLRQQTTDVLQRFRHLIPPVHLMAQIATLRPGRSRPGIIPASLPGRAFALSAARQALVGLTRGRQACIFMHRSPAMENARSCRE